MSQSESRWDVSQSLNIRPRDRWRLTLSVGVRPWLYPRAVCRCHCKQQSAWPIRICKDMHQKRSTISCTWIWVTTALDKNAAVATNTQRYSLQLHMGQRFSCYSKPLTTDLYCIRSEATDDLGCLSITISSNMFKLMSAANSFEHPLNYT